MNAQATYPEARAGRSGAARHGSGGGGVSAGGLGRALWRSRWLVLGLTLAGFLAALAFVLVTPPRYTTEARLLLEARDGYFTRPAGEREPNTPPQIDEQAVVSQVQLLTSRDLAREAVRRLGLVGDPEFDPSPEGSILSRMLAMVGLAGGGRDGRPEDRIVGRFSDRLLVYPVRQSRVIAVEFSSRDPELAARGANLVAGLYLEFQADSKKEESRSAGTWLSTAIDPLRRRVEEAEAKVEAFRARSGLFMGSNNNTLGAQLLSDLSTAANAARTARDEARTRAKLLREAIARGRTLDIAEVAGNELVRRLAESRAAVSGQIASEGRTLGPRHPRMRELEARLTGLDAGIKDAATKAVRNLENDAKVAQGRFASAEAALDEQKRAAADGTAADVELRALEREAKAQRDQLEVYLARLREASTRDADKPVLPDARIISRAVAPAQPSFPKKLPTVTLATIGSLVLGLAFVTARELARGATPDEPGPGLSYGTAYDPAFGPGWLAGTAVPSAAAYATPPWAAAATSEAGPPAPEQPRVPVAEPGRDALPPEAEVPAPPSDIWDAAPAPAAFSPPPAPAREAAPAISRDDPAEDATAQGEPLAGAGEAREAGPSTFVTDESAAWTPPRSVPASLGDGASPAVIELAAEDVERTEADEADQGLEGAEAHRDVEQADDGHLRASDDAVPANEDDAAPVTDDAAWSLPVPEPETVEAPVYAGSAIPDTLPALAWSEGAAFLAPWRGAQAWEAPHETTIPVADSEAGDPETVVTAPDEDRGEDGIAFPPPRDPTSGATGAATPAAPEPFAEGVAENPREWSTFERPAPVPERAPAAYVVRRGREPIRTLGVRELSEHVASLRSESAGGVVALALASDDGPDGPLALARALAELLGTVLLDATGGPTQELGLRGAAGLSDLLEGDAAFGDALHPDRASKLHAMPAGRYALLFDEDRLAVLGHVVEALKLSYEAVVVVVSAAPDDPAREALAALADTALAAPAREEEDGAREALRELRAAGVPDACLLGRGGREGYASSLVRGVSRPGVAA